MSNSDKVTGGFGGWRWNAGLLCRLFFRRLGAMDPFRLHLCVAILAFIYRLSLLSPSIEQLEVRCKQAEEMSCLHLRTIKSLALAIEAKEQSTQGHLERLWVYSMEIGKAMSLSGEEMEALGAAALLHDIGKLAVPEQIINKPGRLTPEEFEKMKIHPLIGAEILSHVNFPFPVVPIVEAHHERWDGAGYPFGKRARRFRWAHAF